MPLNIWSKHELEVKRRKAEEEARGPRRYMSADDLFGSLRVGLGRGVSTADRIDNQGRRYNALLMAIREAKPQWALDAVRAEAQRQLKLEDPARPPWLR